MNRELFATAIGRVISRLLRAQAILAVLASLLAGVFFSVASAVAVLAGAGIGLFLTVFVALRVLTVPAEVQPQRFVSVFNRTMAMKFVLAVVLFAIAARYLSEWFLPIVLGYGVSVVGYWITGLTLTDTDLWQQSQTTDEDQHG